MLEAALHALDKVSTDLASEVTEAVQDALDEFAADMERERVDAARRLPEERPSDPAEYAAAVHHEHQALRHRAHHKLIGAFLNPEIFDGAVTLTRPHHTPRAAQLRLVEEQPDN